MSKSEKATKVFVVTGHSESGDDYGPEVFTKKPSKSQLKKLAHDWDGDEDEDGPGHYGSYVYLEVSERDVKDNG